MSCGLNWDGLKYLWTSMPRPRVLAPHACSWILSPNHFLILTRQKLRKKEVDGEVHQNRPCASCACACGPNPTRLGLLECTTAKGGARIFKKGGMTLCLWLQPHAYVAMHLTATPERSPIYPDWYPIYLWPAQRFRTVTIVIKEAECLYGEVYLNNIWTALSPK